MTDNQTPAPATGGEATAKKDAKPTKEKKVKVKRVSKINPDGKIYFGKDKEGKKYGPANNPKRPGSATHDRFARYKEGMTVKDTVKIQDGPRMADIGWDSQEDRKFIEIR